MSKLPLNIKIYTTCYNNADILPFVIDYWRLYASSVVVYDNGSTDSSVEILSRHGKWITVKRWDTGGKYDLDALDRLKRTCYEGTVGEQVDLVMVCDIDEVLVYGDKLMSKLQEAKYMGVGLFTVKYYDAVCDKFPNYGNNVLLQNNKMVRFVRNQSRGGGGMLFDPRNMQSEVTAEVDVMHLKMVGVQRYKEYQKMAYRRLAQPRPLEYGVDYFSAVQRFNYCVADSFSDNNLKRRVIASLSSGGYMDIEQNGGAADQLPNNIIPRQIIWKNQNIQYSGHKKCAKGRVVVIIPVYKSSISASETASLKQCVKVLGGKYDIVLVGPDDLYFEYYDNISGHKFDVLRCNREYFKNRQTYSMLCETWQFYEVFSKYDFMLLYQLDGWIFYDDIRKFQILDFDYIGSPWVANSYGCPVESVGNGGVSFRKIQSFIRICKALTADDFKSKYSGTEDLFFCRHVKTRYPIDIASVETALLFSWDCEPMHWYGRSNGHLPMCAHAWCRQMEFWKEHINYQEVVEERLEIKTEKPHKPHHHWKHHRPKDPSTFEDLMDEEDPLDSLNLDKGYEIKDAKDLDIYDVQVKEHEQSAPLPPKPTMPELGGDYEDLEHTPSAPVPTTPQIGGDSSFTIIKDLETEQTQVVEHKSTKKVSTAMVTSEGSHNDDITTVDIPDLPATSGDSKKVNQDILRIKSTKASGENLYKTVSNLSVEPENDVEDLPDTTPTPIDKKTSTKASVQHQQAVMSQRVALCAIAKNENKYIKEWVDHYLKMGVDMIYIYDNNELDGERFEDVLGDYINDGLVMVIDVRGIQKGLVFDKNNINLQPKCYIDCYREYGEDFDWMCFFDVDEFLDMRNGMSLKETLASETYKRYDTICVSWQHYDDNGLMRYDARPVRERFTTFSKLSNHGLKSIVRTGRDVYTPNGVVMEKQIHYFRLNGLRACYCDGHGLDIKSNNWLLIDDQRHNLSPMWLAHYKTKSAEEFLQRQCGRYWGTSVNVAKKVTTVERCKKEYFLYNTCTPEKQKYFDDLARNNNA